MDDSFSAVYVGNRLVAGVTVMDTHSHATPIRIHINVNAWKKATQKDTW